MKLNLRLLLLLGVLIRGHSSTLPVGEIGAQSESVANNTNKEVNNEIGVADDSSSIDIEMLHSDVKSAEVQKSKTTANLSNTSGHGISEDLVNFVAFLEENKSQDDATIDISDAEVSEIDDEESCEAVDEIHEETEETNDGGDENIADITNINSVVADVMNRILETLENSESDSEEDETEEHETSLDSQSVSENSVSGEAEENDQESDEELNMPGTSAAADENTPVSDEEEYEEEEKNLPQIDQTIIDSSFYPHNSGIVNFKYTCYMNSIMSCIYSIPCFQNKIYELVESEPYDPLVIFDNSSLLSTAKAFVQMRYCSKPGQSSVEFKATLIRAMKSAKNWEVGQFQDAIEFWENYLETLPDGVKSIFNIEMDLNHITNNQEIRNDSRLKSGEILIFKSEQKHTVFLIPAPKTDTKLSALIQNKFLDLESEDFKISPVDQHEYQQILAKPISEPVMVPCKNTTEIKNTPEILVFGIKRRGYNFFKNEVTLNENRMEADNIRVNGEDYMLTGCVSFSKEHYYAIVRDIKTAVWYLHNDKFVAPLNPFSRRDMELLDVSLHHRGTILFYMKVSTAKAFTVDFEKYSEKKDISDIIIERTKSFKYRKSLIHRESLDKSDEQAAVKQVASKRKRDDGMMSDYHKKRKVSKKPTPVAAPVVQNAPKPAKVVKPSAAKSTASSVEKESVEKKRPEKKTVENVASETTAAKKMIEKVKDKEDDVAPKAPKRRRNKSAVKPNPTASVAEPEAPESPIMLTISAAPEPEPFQDELFDSFELLPGTTELDLGTDIGNEYSTSATATAAAAVAVDRNKRQYDDFKSGQQRYDFIPSPSELELISDLYDSEITQKKAKVDSSSPDPIMATLPMNTYPETEALVQPQASTFNGSFQQNAGFISGPTITNLDNQTVSPASSGIASVPIFGNTGNATGISADNQTLPILDAKKLKSETNKLAKLVEKLEPQEIEYFKQVTSCLNVLEKPGTVLDLKPFAFSKTNGSKAMEIVLTTLLSDVPFIKAILSVKSNSTAEFQHLAIIVVQMLIGANRININSFLRSVNDKRILNSYNAPFLDKIQFCLDYFKKNKVTRKLPLYKSKNIEYLRMNTDEPISVSPEFYNQIVKINTVAQKDIRQLNIPGIYFDFAESNNRLRTVLTVKTNSTAPVIIDRPFLMDGSLDAVELKFSAIGHGFCGGVIYNEDASDVYVQFFRPGSEMLFTFRNSIAEVTPISDLTNLRTKCLERSMMLLFSGPVSPVPETIAVENNMTRILGSSTALFYKTQVYKDILTLREQHIPHRAQTVAAENAALIQNEVTAPQQMQPATTFPSPKQAQFYPPGHIQTIQQGFNMTYERAQTISVPLLSSQSQPQSTSQSQTQDVPLSLAQKLNDPNHAMFAAKQSNPWPHTEFVQNHLNKPNKKIQMVSEQSQRNQQSMQIPQDQYIIQNQQSRQSPNQEACHQTLTAPIPPNPNHSQQVQRSPPVQNQVVQSARPAQLVSHYPVGNLSIGPQYRNVVGYPSYPSQPYPNVPHPSVNMVLERPVQQPQQFFFGQPIPHGQPVMARMDKVDSLHYLNSSIERSKASFSSQSGIQGPITTPHGSQYIMPQDPRNYSSDEKKD